MLKTLKSATPGYMIQLKAVHEIREEALTDVISDGTLRDRIYRLNARENHQVVNTSGIFFKLCVSESVRKQSVDQELTINLLCLKV